MNILQKPVVTEKISAQGERLNRYGFVVDKRANKLQIRSAIEQMYGVTVEDVNTMVYPSRKKTRMSKSGIIEGTRSGFKKALVTLKDGDKIDFYSNI
jgi:large subunit ribosomal protein L23